MTNLKFKNKSKTRIFPAFLSLGISFLLFCSGCATQQRISKDFDPKSKIQTIEVMPKYYVYAQNDKILNSTLEKELSKMNADWGKDISKYKTYQNLHIATALLQFGTLMACIASLNDGNDNDSSNTTLAWCGTSIAFGLISIPLERAARFRKHKVISSYNSKY